MELNLRRGEQVSFEKDRRDVWCLAPCAPMDFCNGRWQWQMTLDEVHLDDEVFDHQNVSVAPSGLGTTGAGEMIYRLHSPWPFLQGRKATRACRPSGPLLQRPQSGSDLATGQKPLASRPGLPLTGVSLLA